MLYNYYENWICVKIMNMCDASFFFYLIYLYYYFLVQRFFDIWELVVSTSWVVWSQWDDSLFLDFCTINHGEINKVLLVVFSSFIMTCLNMVQSNTVSIVHSSNNTQFTSSQVHPISWMELPSWTAPYLDVPFTPPVCKTYTFHQYVSSRDSLMLTVQVHTL